MAKILIIKLSALGDVASALPTINTIATHHSRDEVWLMTSPFAAGLIANLPIVRVVYLDRRKWFRAEGRLARRWWVRRQCFDRVYDLQGNRTGKLLVKSSRAPERVGLKPEPPYNFSPPTPIIQGNNEHQSQRLNATLLCAGLPEADPGRSIYPDESDRRIVDNWKKRNQLENSRYVVLHAGCSPEWPTKQWPRAYFSQLATALEKEGYRCVWIGAGADWKINRMLADEVGLDTTDRFTLPQIYALARGARLAFSNDSCPMHIFALTGIAVYSFFGPTNWRWSGPVGQTQRVFKQDLPCSPCFLKTCPRDKGHACMRGIQPETVLETIKSDMGASKF